MTVYVVMKDEKTEHAFSNKEKAVTYACDGKLTEEQLSKLNSGEPLSEFNGRKIVACPLD